MTAQNNIPVYSLDSFSPDSDKSRLFQVEVFDANRHFQVSYPHRHDFYEVLLITKGSGIHIIDSNSYAIEPPCIFFMSPGQTHKLELSNDIDGFIFLFTAEFYLLNQQNKNRLLEFPFFFSVNQDNPPLLLEKDTETDFIKELFINGCNEIAHLTPSSEEIIRSILDLILLYSNKKYPIQENSHKSKGHIIVKNLLQLIEGNYQRNLRVNDYANLLSITPNHLTQVVKQITGQTPSELITNKIVVEIKRLLIHTNLNISEVAELMNFADTSYFSKYFKNATGITPLQFRKQHFIGGDTSSREK